MADEVLGRMVIELGLNSDAFSKGISGAKKAVRSSMTEMKSMMAVVGQTGNKYEVLAAKQRGLTKVLEAQKTEQAALRKEYEGSITATGQATRKTADYARQYNNATAKVASLNKQLVANAKAMAAAKVETTGFTGGLNKFGKYAQTAGSKLSSLGDSVSSKFSLPVAVGMGYAIKKSVAFQNTMTEIKNLLVTGGESAKEAISGVKQMESDALTYSNKYGVSQQSIAKGYEELVKRGYSSKQALGAMKSELQAAKASGDDFSDVVSVASQTLESFGMKTNSVSGMAKNTKEVVNDLAYAADMTATDFQSLGVGMSYVGSTAHQAGFSLSETASAMGILSNNGLEAEQAGTGLRKAINSLVSPTASASKALKGIGLSTKDFVDKSGKMKSMSDIFGMLNSHMKDLNSTEKEDLFHTIFGTTGQQAALILANNAIQLDNLNKKVEQASKKNYVASLAEKNLKSAQNQIKIFEQSLTNLGMTAANDVLPAIEPLIKDATKLVQGFGKLSKGTQENIVKAVLFAAAFGPVASILGRTVTLTGKLASGSVKIASWIAKLRAGKTALAGLGGAASIAGSATTAAAGGAETLAGSATAATSAISLLNPVVLGIGATVAAGVAVWELWGKKVWQSQQRANRWGSDVGQQADSALTKFRNFSDKTGKSLTDFETESKTSTKQVSKDFSQMYSNMKSDSQQTIKKMQEDMKGLPSSVKFDLQEDIEQRQKYNAKILANAKTAYKNAETILKSHNGKVSELSDTERAALLNYQQQMNKDEVNLLRIGGKAKETVLAALNGNIKKMTRDQRTEAVGELNTSINKENTLYDKQAAKIQKMYDNNELSTKQYKKALQDLNQEHNSVTDSMAAAIYKLDKANGDSKVAIEDDLELVGYSYKEAAAIVKEQNNDMSNSTSLVISGVTNMSKKAESAANMWNGLVFDTKTGKIKTNAQEEVNSAVLNAKKWNQIQLLEKKGKLSSNAKAMVADALIQNGKWNSLSFKQQKMWIQSNAGTQIYKAMSASGQWNSLSFKAKSAIINAKGLPQLAQAIVKYNLWNGLPVKIKQLLASDKSASRVLKQAGVNVSKYNQNNPKTKVLKGNAASVINAADSGKRHIGMYNYTNPMSKAFKGNASSVNNASSSGRRAIGVYNGTSVHSKTLSVRDKASGPVQNAINRLKEYSQINPLEKTITTVIKTVKKVVKGHAKGTNSHPGGLMMVNDQTGARFREMVQYPSGDSFVPFGRNVLLDAPRGTKVFTASMTERILGKLPQYANGVGIPENAKVLTSANNVTNQINRSSSTIVNSTNIDVSGLESKMDQVAKLLMVIAQKESNVVMDGRAVGKLVTKSVSDSQLQDINYAKRGVYRGR